jgi:AICAR transformylase/IMP cyclohydrolase PurH
MYQKVLELRQGQNPHQTKAWAGIRGGIEKFPVTILNGKPGAINMMEIWRGADVVTELSQTFSGKEAAVVLKHKIPAGSAIGLSLDPVQKQMYFCKQDNPSTLAAAYYRAEGTDPIASYGGTVVFSHEVDESAARAMRFRYTDVIAAPGFAPEAFEMLKGKKDGRIVLATFDPFYQPPLNELVEDQGRALGYERSDYTVTDDLLEDVVGGQLTDDQRRDLKLAVVVSKYVKSNSTVYALDGQTTGIMGGQQSRADSIAWAGEKSLIWLARQMPKVLALDVDDLKDYHQKVHAKVARVKKLFDGASSRKKRRRIEKLLRLRKIPGFRIATDGNMPFEDNIEMVNRYGGKVVLDPKVPAKGKRSDEIDAAAKKHGIIRVRFPYRMFCET